MQDLFDSDSDSDSDEEQEEIAPVLSHASTSLRPPPHDETKEPRIGGVLASSSSTTREDDEEIEAYEMAALRKKGETDGEKEASQKPTALQSDRSIQDSLSGELLRMAGILKANSMAFADALERDRQILEQAGEKLQGNLTLMTRTRGKLGEYSKKARGMGWLTLGSVAVVCASWVLMFILIRLT
jgi:hypothetical protein